MAAGKAPLSTSGWAHANDWRWSPATSQALANHSSYPLTETGMCHLALSLPHDLLALVRLVDCFLPIPQFSPSGPTVSNSVDGEGAVCLAKWRFRRRRVRCESSYMLTPTSRRTSHQSKPIPKQRSVIGQHRVMFMPLRCSYLHALYLPTQEREGVSRTTSKKHHCITNPTIFT